MCSSQSAPFLARPSTGIRSSAPARPTATSDAQGDWRARFALFEVERRQLVGRDQAKRCMEKGLLNSPGTQHEPTAKAWVYLARETGTTVRGRSAAFRRGPFRYRGSALPAPRSPRVPLCGLAAAIDSAPKVGRHPYPAVWLRRAHANCRHFGFALHPAILRHVHQFPLHGQRLPTVETRTGHSPFRRAFSFASHSGHSSSNRISLAIWPTAASDWLGNLCCGLVSRAVNSF